VFYEYIIMSISTEDRLNLILLAQQLSSTPSQVIQMISCTDTSTYDKRTNIRQYIKSALGKLNLSYHDSMAIAAHLH